MDWPTFCTGWIFGWVFYGIVQKIVLLIKEPKD